MREFRCKQECFYGNALVKAGAVVLADEESMKGNHCFEELTKTEVKKVEAKTVKKTETSVDKIIKGLKK